MITRIYVNNYRCLVAFETTFDSSGLICGANGVGKSSIFDACRVLRDLASGDLATDDERAIRYSDHTNWLDAKVVEIEIDMSVGNLEFTYTLHVEQISDQVAPRILRRRQYVTRNCCLSEIFRVFDFKKYRCYEWLPP